MSIEAMKQALEHGSFPQGSGVIHALRQAIAEAEKGPVKVTLEDFLKAVEGREKIQGRPVYWAEWPVRESDSSSQRQWVGLTDKEQRDIEDACETVVSKHVFNVIEAKLRSKNT